MNWQISAKDQPAAGAAPGPDATDNRGLRRRTNISAGWCASITASYPTWTRVLNSYTDGTIVSFSCDLWIADNLQDSLVPLELKLRAPRTLLSCPRNQIFALFFLFISKCETDANQVSDPIGYTEDPLRPTFQNLQSPKPSLRAL